jgi:hypothetical protein
VNEIRTENFRLGVLVIVGAQNLLRMALMRTAWMARIEFIAVLAGVAFSEY